VLHAVDDLIGVGRKDKQDIETTLKDKQDKVDTKKGDDVDE
jgi:hypothetical protein